MLYFKNTAVKWECSHTSFSYICLPFCVFPCMGAWRAPKTGGGGGVLVVANCTPWLCETSFKFGSNDLRFSGHSFTVKESLDALGTPVLMIPPFCSPKVWLFAVLWLPFEENTIECWSVPCWGFNEEVCAILLGRLDMVWGTGDEEPLFDELFPRPMKGRILLPGKKKRKSMYVCGRIHYILLYTYIPGA